MNLDCVKRWLFAFAAFPLFLFGGSFVVNSGEIVLGEWNSSLTKGLAYASENHIPMVLVYANPGCGNCATLKSSFTSNWFNEWQSNRRLVMVFDEGGSAARAFARNPSGNYPYVCVLWERLDGTASTNRFSGISGQMPVKSTTSEPLSLDQQMAKSVDYYISDYEGGNYTGGHFLNSGDEGDRFEVLPTTKSLYIPFAKTSNLDQSGTNSVRVVWNGVTNDTVVWVWHAGETEKSVTVTLPEGKIVGENLFVELYDHRGILVEVRTVPVVEEPLVGPRNPVWIGERSEFQFGEWTMDYDMATNAVAKVRGEGRRAYTLAMFTGALWCPYCKGLEGSLITSEEFLAWAREKNVALVEFDQARLGKNGPRLLNYVPDPNLTSNCVSGASYMSRKSIKPLAAATVIDRVTRYSTQAWLAPEATASRLGNPTILLIENDKVVGRFASWRDRDRVYDVDENLARLEDFLLLADRESEMDDYRSTTTRTYAIGEEGSCALQISDRQDFFKLSRLVAGTNTFELVEKGPVDVMFSLYRDGVQVFVGTNRLDAVLTSTDLEHAFYLKVGAYANTSEKVFANGEKSTVFTARFASSALVLPEERLTSGDVVVGEKCPMVVTSGEKYVLSGFTEESLATGFMLEDQERGVWTAKESGVVELIAAVSKVSYQHWRPGTVSFVVSKLTVTEGNGDTVALQVTRENGSSGALKVQIALDEELSKEVAAERYVWTDTAVEWADGESETKQVALGIQDDIVYDGDQKIYFGLKLVEGEGVALVNDRVEVEIREDDKKATGRLSIADCVPQFARKMSVVAEEGSELVVTIERREGAEGSVSAVLRPSNAFLDATNLVWEHRSRENVKTVVYTLPTIGECPTRKLTLTLDPKGISVDASAKVLTVQLTSNGAPAFENGNLEVDAVRYIGVEADVGVVGVEDPAKASIAKISGSVAPGIKIAYDAANSKLKISGVPTKPGIYTSVYQVRETRAGVVVVGGVVSLQIHVVDPTKGSTSVEANPSVSVSRSFGDLPVVDQNAGRIIGLMNVTIPPTGRVSAKYTSSQGVKAMTSSNWESISSDGTLSTTVSTRDGAYSAVVSVAPNGVVAIEVWDPDYAGDTISCTAGDAISWSRMSTAVDWSGLYTVACIKDRVIAGSEEVAPSGHAVFTLKAKGSSALNSGKVSYVGWLPNGVSVSGSAALRAIKGSDFATLPIFKRSNTDVFSMQLDIRRGAASRFEKYKSSVGDGESDADKIIEEHMLAHRAIVSSEKVEPYLKHLNAKAEVAEYELSYAAIGAYYDPTEDLASCLKTTEVSPNLTFTVAAADVTESVRYGKVGQPSSVAVRVSSDGLSSSGIPLSFARVSGLVSGSVVLPFENDDVKATWKAVVLPGWTGCGCFEDVADYPFFLGSCWFQDEITYSDDWATCTDQADAEKKLKVKRGCSVSAVTHTDL